MWTRLRFSLLGASLLAAALAAGGVRDPGVLAAAFLASAIAGATVTELIAAAPAPRPAPILRMLRKRRGYWGGQLAHLGVAMVALAIAVSGGLDDRASLSLQKGQSAEFAGYTLTFTGDYQRESPDRTSRIARIVFQLDGEKVYTAQPQLTQFANQVQSVATPAVWTTPTRDLYVSLSSFEDGRIGVNLYRYPYIWMLWTGGLIVMAGGLWALLPRLRRRRSTAPAERPAVEDSRRA